MHANSVLAKSALAKSAPAEPVIAQPSQADTRSKAEAWFQDALALQTGDAFMCADVRREAALGGAQVATCAASARTDGQPSGVVRDPQRRTVTAFHRTPGYETHRGLGWYGVIVQADRARGRPGGPNA